MWLQQLVRLCRELKATAMRRSWGFLTAVLVIDATAAFLVTFVFLTMFDSAYLSQVNPGIASLIFAGFSVVFLVLLRTQKFIWRFISLRDSSVFLTAAALVTAISGLVVAEFGPPAANAMGKVALAVEFLLFGTAHAGLLAGAWLGARFAWQIMQDVADMEAKQPDGQKRVLLVSAGVGCVHLLRGLQGAHASPIEPVGILDFNTQQIGRVLRGIPILGSPLNLDEVVAELARKGCRPEEVILTTRLTAQQTLDVIERTVALKIKVSKLPSPGETSALIERGLSPTEPITLQTIGGREPQEFDRHPIVELLADKCILVTGAGGSIGSQLVELIASFGPSRICLVDNSEFNLWKVEQHLQSRFPDLSCLPRLTDIRDAKRLHQVFAEARPQLVFHAAALKHVPMVEANPAEGVLTNIVGTRNVADAALEAGVEAMVQVSTDKAVMPTSVMGATKRIAEIYCQALDLAQSGPRFMTVRFGNVLGSSGSVVPVFEKQILNGGPVTVTHPEMERYFMTILEACELILHSAAHSARDPKARGVINVLDMGEPVKIVDVARRMILLHGLIPEVDIKIQFTGMRPGEKLVEDLFNVAEARLESAIAGVHTALSEGVPFHDIKQHIAELAEYSSSGDHKGIMKILEAVVPGYQAPHITNSSSEAA